MIRTTGRALLFLCLVLPGVVRALGLGTIEVDSALNEPLRASIPLRGLQSGDLQDLKISLGSAEQFQRAGLVRPFVLSRLRFEVEETGPGTGVIRITTRRPINEPYLDFLLDVDWPRGRIIREYTLLLDPPVYGAAIATTTRESVPTVESEPDLDEAPEVAAAPAPEAAPSMPDTSRGASPGTYGPVASRETLWSIAQRVRPDSSVSVQRMMLAILEANPGAFVISNVNALREGAVLRIPERTEIGADDKASAMAEVRRQQEAWEQYRRRIAGGAPPAPEGAPAPTTAAAGATEPASEAPVGAEDEARLEVLGGGQAGGTGAAPGEDADVAELREELNLALEDADSKARQAEELRDRLGEAEQLIQDLQRLVELKEEDIAALQRRLAEAEATTEAGPARPAAPAPMEEEEAAPAPETTARAEAADEPSEPAAAPKDEAKPEKKQPEKKLEPLPPPPPQPTSFLDELRSTLPVDPVILAGGLGVLLIAAGGFALYRKRQGGGEGEVELTVDEDGETVIGHSAQTVVPGITEDVTERPGGTEVDDDETEFAPPSADAGAEAEEDPLAEVNVYLAYERFDQAADLVRSSIEQYPDRHEYRLKLLEIYHAAKDAPSFQESARELRDVAGEDSPLIERAAGLWADLAPDRELFGGPPETTVEETSDETVVDEGDLFDVGGGEDEGTGVDFDLGFELGDEDEESAGTGSGVDFDLGGEEETEAGTGLDFDLGEDEQGSASSAASGDEEDDFDFLFEESDEEAPSGQQDAPAASAAAREAEEGGDEGLDFDLGSGEERQAEPVAQESADAGEEGGLDLDFTGFGEEEEPSEETAQGQESPAAQEPSDAGGEEALDFDFTGFGEEEPSEETAQAQESPAAQEPSDAGGEEALDLDFTGFGEEEPSEETAQAQESPAAQEPSDAGGEEALDLDFTGFGEEEEPSEETAQAQESPAAQEPSDAGGEEALDLDFTGFGEEEPSEETAQAQEPPAAQEPSDAGGEEALDLDFSGLGEEEPPGDETGAETSLAEEGGGEVTRAGAPEEDVGLDLDLGDEEKSGDGGEGPGSASEEATRSGEESGIQLDESMLEGAGRSGEKDERTENLGGGIDIGGGGEGGEEEQSLDFDLGETDESDSASSEWDDDEAISTVQLKPGQVPAGEGSREPDDDSEVSVDPDFEGLFGDEEASAPDDGSSASASDDDEAQTLVLGRGPGGDVDEAQTKLDLAEAYIEMGDNEGARGILGEVLAEGNADQQAHATSLLAKLG